MNPVSKCTRKIRREKTTTSNLDLSNNAVQVFCRLRPLKNHKESTCIKLTSPRTLVLTTPLEFKGTRKDVHCQFKHIFTAFSSQNDVFEHVAHPLLGELLKRKNWLLFTYGVTGSGIEYLLKNKTCKIVSGFLFIVLSLYGLLSFLEGKGKIS